MKDFFISYNKSDRQWAEWIAYELEENNYTTIIQAWDFRPGSNFVLDMQDALQEADRIIAILSPLYLASKFTASEWASAFSDDPDGKKGSLIPIRVKECKPGGLLSSIVYIDLLNLDEESAREKLVSGVICGRQKPKHRPGYPGVKDRSITEKPNFPMDNPLIGNVPHRRNRNFTGREEILKQLHNELESGEPAALTQAISGLGGIGKTQLALEYSYRYADRYEVLWWMLSEDPVTLASDYASLAIPLDLPEARSSDQAAIIKAVCHWLSNHHNWLLVFDNAQNSEQVRPYLPDTQFGHVIITSRNPSWRNVARPLQVTVMSVAEAIELLHKRTGLNADHSAEKLAEKLGYLPLALEQAGAYIESHSESYAGYLNLFLEEHKNLWKEESGAGDYEKTVATTWTLSMDSIRENSPEAYDLMKLCSYLAPDDISWSLFQGGKEFLPDTLSSATDDRILRNRIIGNLIRYSLITVIDDSLSMHRLVQSVIRDSLDGEEEQAWCKIALEIINNAFPYEKDDLETWPACDRLLSHVEAVASRAEELRIVSEAYGRLLNAVGLYLNNRAELANSKKMLERALAIDEKIYGPDHPEVATDVNNLGGVLQDQGDLAGAREHFERALA
ncbi:MAG TPA: FxSxx-COOH system tetratricopeptide repeat protein, partial [Patescibacteria group bacterium]|nr:FxSxx-COOH system tetratricopeptide repeat protein [Patescibacteria group bacterium]